MAFSEARDARSILIGTLCATSFVSLMLLGTLYVAPMPQHDFGQDMFLFLEGGWKWQWGVLPHRDYYSPLGPLTYILTSCGIGLGGSLAKALPVAVCLFACSVFPIVLYVAFTRMPPAIAFLTTITVMATALAPHVLRYGSEVWSYAGVYNRWGYVLLSVGFLAASLRASSPRRWSEAIDGAIFGSFLSLAVFLKINYGIVMVQIAVCAALLNPRSFRFYASAAIAAAVGSLLFLALLHGSLQGFINDILMAACTRKELNLSAMLQQVRFLQHEIIMLYLLSGMWYLTRLLGTPTRRDLFNALAWPSVLSLSAALILATNFWGGRAPESPILVVGALMILTLIFRDLEPTSSSSSTEYSRLRNPLMLLTLMVALALILPQLGRNAYSLIKIAKLHHAASSLPNEQVFGVGELKGVQMLSHPSEIEHFLISTYVQRVEDGVALLASTGNENAAVASLDFTNPFNVVRGVKPSRGNPTFWHYGVSFNERAAPPASQVFAGAEAVMIPKMPLNEWDDHLPALEKHYGKFIEENYGLRGESKFWKLYVPK